MDFWIWVSFSPHMNRRMGIRPGGTQESRKRKTRWEKEKHHALHFQIPPNINQLPCAVLPFAVTNVLPQSTIRQPAQFTNNKDLFPDKPRSQVEPYEVSVR
jgi:hypothetical protein